ncbi:unnamed protein product [Cyprideis torosa]|uniref:Uncharacterized protein n=1 Tax=Cyprideis torosa TaxID=163714 RepID=A0A7R8WQZ3_9CRUS|nr:unnamed protein product [Cyprideis torosa]CAG0908401.1 unnamed protein product [Cyprideis torosa]
MATASRNTVPVEDIKNVPIANKKEKKRDDSSESVTPPGPSSPVPLHVNLTIQDADSCSEQFKKFPQALPNGVTKDMLCAGDRGKDTCQNDSGGPLLFDARQNLDGTLVREFVLVGVVSGGIGCGETPGIYTRVSSYTDWILETMLEKSQMNKDAV